MKKQVFNMYLYIIMIYVYIFFSIWGTTNTKTPWEKWSTFWFYKCSKHCKGKVSLRLSCPSLKLTNSPLALDGLALLFSHLAWVSFTSYLPNPGPGPSKQHGAGTVLSPATWWWPIISKNRHQGPWLHFLNFPSDPRPLSPNSSSE